MIALTQLAAERNLPRETVLSAIEAALVSAYKKDSIMTGQDISVQLDPATGDVAVYILKTVVEEIEDPQFHILKKDAEKIRPAWRSETAFRRTCCPRTPAASPPRQRSRW